MRRHTREAYELVLDPVVPQLGRDLGGASAEEVEAVRCLEVVLRQAPDGPQALEAAMRDGRMVMKEIMGQAVTHETRRREQEDSGARSSNKMGKRRKKRKRRKKKLPKRSSSSFLHGLRGMGDQGILFEYAEDENEEVAGNSGRVDTAPCMKEMGEFIEEKVVRTREFIHKHGQLVKTEYSDRLHLYTQSSGRCWLDWMKDRLRYVWWLGCLWRWTGMLLSHDCCEERVEQTPSTTAEHR